MSTRSNVVITDYTTAGRAKDTKIYLYHHHDGYLTGVGALLLDCVCREGYKMQSAQECRETILALNNKYPDGVKFEDTTCVHGDIEYLYKIDIVWGYQKKWKELHLSATFRDFSDFDAIDKFKPIAWGGQFVADCCKEEEPRGKDLSEYTNAELVAELAKRLVPGYGEQPLNPAPAEPAAQIPAEIPCDLPAPEDFEPTAEELIGKAVADLKEEQDTTTEQTEDDGFDYTQLSLFAC